MGKRMGKFLSFILIFISLIYPYIPYSFSSSPGVSSSDSSIENESLHYSPQPDYLSSPDYPPPPAYPFPAYSANKHYVYLPSDYFSKNAQVVLGDENKQGNDEPANVRNGDNRFVPPLPYPPGFSFHSNDVSHSSLSSNGSNFLSSTHPLSAAPSPTILPSSSLLYEHSEYSVPLSSSYKCERDTGGKCIFFSCSTRKGATECSGNSCLCRRGYCVNKDNYCVGCEHLTLEVHNVGEQKTKTGVYSAVNAIVFHFRPVWKQENGDNWLWYCPRFSCWIFSYISPNYENCEAGIVSPQTVSVTPFEKEASSWKYWYDDAWNDDEDKNTIVLRCQDRGGIDFIE